VTMDIQVWADVICPWCYIGKRRLEEALRGDQTTTVMYRAYQLDPSPVPQPIPLGQALAPKFGGPDRVREAWAHVRSIAAKDGLVLNFERAVAANTFDAHRLISWAAEQGRQAAMLEALQIAHFSDGVDIGSHPALARVAGTIGLDEASALSYLGSSNGINAVKADIMAARDFGITSVPTFVVDSRYAVQGAQEVQTLRAAFEEIRRRESVDAG
jgi:predicted DsbA family dithiol-disulfide isomerase